LKWSFSTSDLVESSPAIADIDGDGKLEVLVGSHDGNLYCLDGRSGARKWAYRPRASAQFFSSPTLADLDGDGLLEIIIGNNNSGLYVLGA
jgi:outer membrane protein assembly factor BamB